MRGLGTEFQEEIMLVLSRRDGQEIVVGDDIVIKVLSIDGGRVRVGIEAPMNVQIRRAELERKQFSMAAPSWGNGALMHHMTAAAT
jgi:carbon storage regulator